ncbi:MAG: hypothetical protein RRY21_06745, partial [Oscillospiraceae bacterium]
HATNADLMLAAAKDRLAQEPSLAGVTVEIKVDAPSGQQIVNYEAPTTEAGGHCAVSFLLRAGDDQRTSLIDVLLPLVPKA